jgi:aspartate/tyrosine/aromatic aminotransferase
LGIEEWVNNPTGEPQQNFPTANLEIETYPYYDPETHSLDWDKMLAKQ